MSGLLRNLIAFVIGLFAYGSKAVDDVTEVKFLVTPFDGGVPGWSCGRSIGENEVQEGPHNRAAANIPYHRLFKRSCKGPGPRDRASRLLMLNSSFNRAGLWPAA